MKCPYCRMSLSCSVKRGFFRRKSTNTARIQRYFCKIKKKGYSQRTLTPTYREKKAYLNQALFGLLCSGVSQRRCALILSIHQKTVARKLVRLNSQALATQQSLTKNLAPVTQVVFDEMETFEHTKCKPLSICVAVEKSSRFILAAKVEQMPAKGLLAKISRKKYGPRADHRKAGLSKVLSHVKAVSVPSLLIESDECPRYTVAVKRYLPYALHRRYKGRRGCIVGQGELKRGGFDPLFSLNHSCAMFRDNLKRLTRKSWCTTKKPQQLQMLVNLYVCFHNLLLIDPKGRFKLKGSLEICTI